MIFSFDDSKVEMIFPKTIKIEDSLFQFLKTNSIIEFSSERIFFLYKGIVLNKSNNLKKSLSQVFTRNLETYIVKVVKAHEVAPGRGGTC